MNTFENAEAMIERNDEVRRVHDSLPRWDQYEFAQFLNDMLTNHNTMFGPEAKIILGHKASPEIHQGDLEEFCSTARALAKRYVDQPLWHTPWLTRYLLDDVLETQCTYLAWASERGVFPEWSLRRSLPFPYRLFVPPLVSVAFFVGYVWLLSWLLTNDYLIAAALLAAFMLYFYLIEKPRVWWYRRKNRQKFFQLAQLLVTPLYEIRFTIPRQLAVAYKRVSRRTCKSPALPSHY